MRMRMRMYIYELQDGSLVKQRSTFSWKTRPFCSLKWHSTNISIRFLKASAGESSGTTLWTMACTAIKRVITYPWHATKSVHYVTLMFPTKIYIPEHSVAEHTKSEGNCWTPWSPWTVHSVVMLDAFQMLFCFRLRCMSMPKEYKTLTLS